MNYYFYKARDVLWIREQEIGVGEAIRFSNFDSCIGVVAFVGNKIWGAHLVLTGNENPLKPSDKESRSINSEDVSYLRNIFPDQLDETYICGKFDEWESNARFSSSKDAIYPGLDGVCQKLKILFKNKDGKAPNTDYGHDGMKFPDQCSRSISNRTFDKPVIGLHLEDKQNAAYGEKLHPQYLLDMIG